MSDQSDQSVSAAAETLRTVGDIRSSTRLIVGVSWFPMILWGAIVLLSAPLTLAADPLIGIYWVLAAPLGVLLTIGFYRRRGLEHGLQPRHHRIYLAIGVTIAVTGLAFGAFGGELVSVLGPMVAVALGLLAFAALNRVAAFAWVAAALIAAAAVIAVADPAEPALVAALVEGMVLLLAGCLLLIGHRPSRGAGATGAAGEQAPRVQPG